MQRAREERRAWRGAPAKRPWQIVALDLGVDTTTPAGELVAGMMAQLAQWERRVIGDRTREALAAKRAQGATLGRPVMVSANLVRRISADYRHGRSLAQIASRLNEHHVPTAHGGSAWHHSTVAAILRRAGVELRSRAPMKETS
jgi:DNA invertase Pin-like site-specific DNA recombinase